MAERVHFYLAYGHYLRGTATDARNEREEACAPARRALESFRAVGPHLGRAGSYEGAVQAQLRDVLDRQIYRQEQIIKAACGCVRGVTRSRARRHETASLGAPGVRG